MLQTYPLVGNGLHLSFFHHLFRPGNTSLNEDLRNVGLNMHITIPETVLFDKYPSAWYYYDDDVNEVKRRTGREVSAENIYSVFTSVASSDVVCAFYSIDESAESAFVRYMSAPDLAAFLASPPQYRGMLQQVMPAVGEHSSALQIAWSPRVAHVSKVGAVARMSDPKVPPHVRIATFDAPPHTTRPLLVPSALTARCATVASVLARRLGTPQRTISRLVFVAAESATPDTFTILYCTSVRTNRLVLNGRGPDTTLLLPPVHAPAGARASVVLDVPASVAAASANAQASAAGAAGGSVVSPAKRPRVRGPAAPMLLAPPLSSSMAPATVRELAATALADNATLSPRLARAAVHALPTSEPLPMGATSSCAAAVIAACSAPHVALPTVGPGRDTLPGALTDRGGRRARSGSAAPTGDGSRDDAGNAGADTGDGDGGGDADGGADVGGRGANTRGFRADAIASIEVPLTLASEPRILRNFGDIPRVPPAPAAASWQLVNRQQQQQQQQQQQHMQRSGDGTVSADPTASAGGAASASGSSGTLPRGKRVDLRGGQRGSVVPWRGVRLSTVTSSASTGPQLGATMRGAGSVYVTELYARAIDARRAAAAAAKVVDAKTAAVDGWGGVAAAVRGEAAAVPPKAPPAATAAAVARKPGARSAGADAAVSDARQGSADAGGAAARAPTCRDAPPSAVDPADGGDPAPAPIPPPPSVPIALSAAAPRVDDLLNHTRAVGGPVTRAAARAALAEEAAVLRAQLEGGAPIEALLRQQADVASRAPLPRPRRFELERETELPPDGSAEPECDDVYVDVDGTEVLFAGADGRVNAARHQQGKTVALERSVVVSDGQFVFSHVAIPSDATGSSGSPRVLAPSSRAAVRPAASSTPPSPGAAAASQPMASPGTHPVASSPGISSFRTLSPPTYDTGDALQGFAAGALARTPDAVATLSPSANLALRPAVRSVGFAGGHVVVITVADVVAISTAAAIDVATTGTLPRARPLGTSFERARLVSSRRNVSTSSGPPVATRSRTVSGALSMAPHAAATFNSATPRPQSATPPVGATPADSAAPTPRTPRSAAAVTVRQFGRLDAAGGLSPVPTHDADDVDDPRAVRLSAFGLSVDSGHEPRGAAARGSGALMCRSPVVQRADAMRQRLSNVRTGVANAYATSLASLAALTQSPSPPPPTGRAGPAAAAPRSPSPPTLGDVVVLATPPPDRRDTSAPNTDSPLASGSDPLLTALLTAPSTATAPHPTTTASASGDSAAPPGVRPQTALPWAPAHAVAVALGGVPWRAADADVAAAVDALYLLSTCLVHPRRQDSVCVPLPSDGAARVMALVCADELASCNSGVFEVALPPTDTPVLLDTEPTVAAWSDPSARPIVHVGQYGLPLTRPALVYTRVGASESGVVALLARASRKLTSGTAVGVALDATRATVVANEPSLREVAHERRRAVELREASGVGAILRRQIAAVGADHAGHLRSTSLRRAVDRGTDTSRLSLAPLPSSEEAMLVWPALPEGGRPTTDASARPTDATSDAGSAPRTTTGGRVSRGSRPPTHGPAGSPRGSLSPSPSRRATSVPYLGGDGVTDIITGSFTPVWAIPLPGSANSSRGALPPVIAGGHVSGSATWMRAEGSELGTPQPPPPPIEACDETVALYPPRPTTAAAARRIPRGTLQGLPALPEDYAAHPPVAQGAARVESPNLKSLPASPM